ncbi:ATP-binding protein [candidate division KSB1 bacterium]|nr:ATP-binding protein [candidate division KSB1 bacterium]
MAKGKEKIIEIAIPSEPDKIHYVEAETEKLAKKLGFDEDTCDNLGIAVTEVVANAITHGNKKDKTKKVYIKYVFSDKVLKIHIRDEGRGFKPENIANPLEPENIYKESGRGIFIVNTLMDDVKYLFDRNGSEIILIKKF